MPHPNEVIIKCPKTGQPCSIKIACMFVGACVAEGPREPPSEARHAPQ